MTIDTSLLDPVFYQKVQRVLDLCQGQGVEMRPYFGIRTPFEQARLWRQSRSREEIAAKIVSLRSQGAPYLAACLDAVGPQNGPPVTNALPGLSWHQWGEAIDCVWIVAGQSEWSTQKKVNGVNGYAFYAQQARAVGLDPGGLWKSLKDWPHLQLRTVSSPAKLYPLDAIERAMAEKFKGVKR